MSNVRTKTENLQPPQSLDAEQAVLGAMLKDQEAVTVMLAALKVDDFYYPKHRTIFSACRTLDARSEPCDITTVSNQLLKDGELKKVGGRVYLVELIEGVASTANVKYHSDIVRDMAVRRGLIVVCDETACDAREGKYETPELLSITESGIAALSKGVLESNIVSLKDTVNDTLERMELFQDKEYRAKWMGTGFKDIDYHAGGVAPGESVMIAGDSFHGKTTFMLQWARYIVRELGRRAGIFSIEMTNDELDMRQVCIEANVDRGAVFRGELSPRDWDKVRDAAARIKGMTGDILINDNPAMSASRLLLEGRRMVERDGVDILFVDYFQIMEPDHHNSRKSQNEQYEEIARRLKVGAKQLGVPIVVLSQLSMGGDKSDTSKPSVKKMRGSAAIGHAADRVILVWRNRITCPTCEGRSSEYLCAKCNGEGTIPDPRIIVGKNRLGTGWTGELSMGSKYGRWENWSGRME